MAKDTTLENSNFIWTDLSTFDLEATKYFYTKIFGWQYKSEDDYHFGYLDSKQVAGLFVMPDKFQKIGLPSFWMSYISVTDIENVVHHAQQMGGMIEVKPTDFMGQGRIALIRDPAGAGFTVWEGTDLKGKDTTGIHGKMVWNELYVSDSKLVLDFYHTVLGWSFTLDRSYSGERYDIRNGDGTIIAAMEVISNEVKGKEEFWVPYFSVTDLDRALGQVVAEGGQILDHSQTVNGNQALAKDPQGAAFMLVETQGVLPETQPKPGTMFDRLKPRTLLGLIIIYIAVLFNLQWVWGLFFALIHKGSNFQDSGAD